jgi:anti-anti-sigma regulatory factor
MLRIQRSANGHVVFKLSGRIEAEDLRELREVLALETTGKQLILDLRDVTLVNQDVIKFLGSCEADSIKLENCPAYIREWIDQVRSRSTRLPTQ